MKLTLSRSITILLGVIYLIFVFKLVIMLKSRNGSGGDMTQAFISMLHEGTGVSEFNATQYILGESMEEDISDPYKKHGFNIIVSHQLPSNREVPDTRQNECLDQVYSESLPSTSVIICFHNEARSTLLRTVISVLNRSPPSLIHEIILVDDFSDDSNDGILLEVLPKVKVLRNNAREGLVRSRITGADYATAPVLTFLDSHCECNVGWLEPLLQRVMEDFHIIACPVIDWIDRSSFSYNQTSSNLIAVFDWKLQLTWNDISEGKLNEQRPKSSVLPVKTPIIAGGLFSINRERFIETGKYDSEMDIWGGENLEISFRTWMCGGSMEIIPCSRVGHVFRPSQPYLFPKGKIATSDVNSNRVAEVWMDEYKELYYFAKQKAKQKGYGNIDERVNLRRRLNCSKFSWYIENVFPKLKVMIGEIQQNGYCLELVQHDDGHTPIVSLEVCNSSNNNQVWTITSSQALQSSIDGWYLTLDSKDNTVSLQQTTGLYNQRWIYSHEKRMIVNLEKGDCLHRSSSQQLMGAPCVGQHSLEQNWTISMRKINHVH